MRLLLALCSIALASLTAGCGAGPPSPESVARAWSEALNEGNNEAAAKLFAPNAVIVQSGMVLRLKTHQDAVDWNAALPCSGRIVSIAGGGDTATATFVLGDRKASICNGPGQRARALFRVREGKIVLWHQTSASGPGGPTV